MGHSNFQEDVENIFSAYLFFIQSAIYFRDAGHHEIVFLD